MDMKKVGMLMKRFSGLVPPDTKNYVGVEIEFAAPFSRLMVVSALVENNLYDYVSLGNDGSINGFICSCGEGVFDCYCEPDFRLIKDPPEEHATKKDKLAYHIGYELRLLATEGEIFKIVDRAIKAIKEVDGKVNATCGLHIHIDARKFKDSEFVKKSKDWFNAQEAILKCVKKHRHSSKYCVPAATADHVMGGNHYTGVHYTTKKTFEVRFHHATLNPKRINNWIALLLKIKYSTISKKLKAKSELVQELKLKGPLKKYLESKIG